MFNIFIGYKQAQYNLEDYFLLGLFYSHIVYLLRYYFSIVLRVQFHQIANKYSLEYFCGFTKKRLCQNLVLALTFGDNVVRGFFLTVDIGIHCVTSSHENVSKHNSISNPIMLDFWCLLVTVNYYINMHKFDLLSMILLVLMYLLIGCKYFVNINLITICRTEAFFFLIDSDPMIGHSDLSFNKFQSFHFLE